jgi:hypothetical protein
MKRKRVKAKTKTKSTEQFKSFAIAILAVVLLVVIAISIQGSKSGDNSPVAFTPEVQAQSASGAYVFVKAVNVGTSWGAIMYSDGQSAATDTGLWGASPVLVGNYIYAIKYVTNAPGMSTQPVKFNVLTNETVSLGTPNQPGDYANIWTIVDAVPNGRYLIGKMNTFSVYKSNGQKLRTVSGGSFGSAELSDDGNYVVYNKNWKGYIQAVSGWSSAKKIAPTGDVSDIATNANGSKAAFITRIGSVDKVYYWNGSSSVAIQTATTGLAVTLDMDSVNRVLWAGSTVSSPGDYHVYLYNGSTADLTPTPTSFPSRWYPSSNGTGILYGQGDKLYGGDSSGFAVIGTFPTLVEMVSWGK